MLRRLLIAIVALMLAGKVLAYDGDVDFSAPYLTVDPETGELVTVDPKQGTVTPHPLARDPVASTQSGGPEAEPGRPTGGRQKIVVASAMLAALLGGAFFLRRSRQATRFGGARSQR